MFPQNRLTQVEEAERVPQTGSNMVFKMKKTKPTGCLSPKWMMDGQKHGLFGLLYAQLHV